MNSINTEINKIENFIEINFKKAEKNSVNYKRLISYAYYLEKIKIDFENLDKEDMELKNSNYLSIINEINNLKELIIINSKKL